MGHVNVIVNVGMRCENNEDVRMRCENGNDDVRMRCENGIVWE